MVSADKELEELGNCYEVAEGPLWWHEAGHLIFSEVRGNKRRQWTPGIGITLLQESTNNANGLTRDLQGRMILCEDGAGRVARMEPDGSITVVANSYQGMRLNRPNDVVVRSSDGSIYFTNPGAPDPEFPLPYFGVYRVSAASTECLRTWVRFRYWCRTLPFQTAWFSRLTKASSTSPIIAAEGSGRST